MKIICHNGVSDFECLRNWGINLKDEDLYWDSMLMGHLIDSSLKDYSLKGMAKRELGITYPSYDDIVGKKGLKTPRVTLDKQPLELVAAYNACDTYCTYKLYEKQKKVFL
jgi:DNA polymerase I-like protein with 3'-5' exonuclease and polymerase domains